MEKAYSRITWVNNMPPAINESNLNHIEAGLDTVDTRVVTLDTTKANVSTVNTAIRSLELDTETGIFTITKIDGTVLYLESSQGKIATNFTYDAQNQRLVLTLADGTTQYVDMSALITEYEFNDSSTISFTVAPDGSVSASVKNGSITDAMLENGYLATLTNLKTQTQGYRNEAHDYASNAEYDANLARSYAIGTNGEIRQGDATDNAKYYCEEAQRQTGTMAFYDSISSFPVVGVDGKLYVAKDTGYMYRYNTTSNEYVQVGGGGSIDAEDVNYSGRVPNVDNVSDALDNVYNRTILAYRVSAPEESTMDSADYIPFFDDSEGASKNITLPNFVNTLAPNFGSQVATSQGYLLDLLDKDGGLLDSVEIQTTANRVSYDNTSSGLSATQVQAAIDEVDGNLDSVSSTVNSINIKAYQTDDATETTLDDADKIPFYDASVGGKKKIAWSNIVTKIKTSLANYFGRKFSQSNGKLSLLANDGTSLDTVTLAPLATNTSYTDTNNIGATNVQSAVDKLGTFTTGTLTINSAYGTGNASYQKFGKVVTVFLADVRFTAQPAGGSWNTPFVSGLPKVANSSGVNPKIYLEPFNNSFVPPIRLAFGAGMTELDFHWTSTSGVPTNVDFNATFSYIAE